MVKMITNHEENAHQNYNVISVGTGHKSRHQKGHK